MVRGQSLHPAQDPAARRLGPEIKSSDLVVCRPSRSAPTRNIAAPHMAKLRFGVRGQLMILHISETLLISRQQRETSGYQRISAGHFANKSFNGML